MFWNYFAASLNKYPDSKVHGASLGPTWVLSAPDGPHVGPWTLLSGKHVLLFWWPQTGTQMNVIAVVLFCICITMCLLGIKYQSTNEMCTRFCCVLLCCEILVHSWYLFPNNFRIVSCASVKWSYSCVCIWVGKLGNHWFRKWLAACSAPSHYLNQRCLISISHLGQIVSEVYINVQTFHRWKHI